MPTETTETTSQATEADVRASDATTATDTHTEADEATDGVEKDWKQEYLKEKAYSRKWEDRSKYNKKELEAIEEKARKYEEYQESLKTEAQKQAEELQRVKQEAESARVELTKLRIATSKGLKPEALKFISGTTEEELNAAADELLSLISTEAKPSVQPVRTQGLTGDTAAHSTEAAWAEVWNNRNR